MWHTWRFLKIRNKNHRTAKRTWGRSRQSGRRLPKPRRGHSGVGDTIRGQRRPRALCPTYGLFSGDPVAGWLSVSAPEGRDKRPLVASLWPETAPGRSRVGCSETDELPGGPAVLGPGPTSKPLRHLVPSPAVYFPWGGVTTESLSAWPGGHLWEGGGVRGLFLEGHHWIRVSAWPGQTATRRHGARLQRTGDCVPRPTRSVAGQGSGPRCVSSRGVGAGAVFPKAPAATPTRSLMHGALPVPEGAGNSVFRRTLVPGSHGQHTWLSVLRRLGLH